MWKPWMLLRFKYWWGVISGNRFSELIVSKGLTKKQNCSPRDFINNHTNDRRVKNYHLNMGSSSHSSLYLREPLLPQIESVDGIATSKDNSLDPWEHQNPNPPDIRHVTQMAMCLEARTYGGSTWLVEALFIIYRDLILNLCLHPNSPSTTYYKISVMVPSFSKRSVPSFVTWD